MRDESERRRSGGGPLPDRAALTALAGEMAGAFPFVEAVYLFGSLAWGRARPSSDIDLAVLPESLDCVEDRVYLEAEMGRFVEARMGVPADVVLVHPGVSLPLLFDIFSMQTILYCRDFERAHNAACRGRAAYREELPRLERIWARVQQRLGERSNGNN